MTTAFRGALVWASILFLLLSSCGTKDDSKSSDPLRIVSWGGQFQDDLVGFWVKPAANSSKIQFETESWDGDSGALTARIKKGTTRWDLVHVEAQYVEHPEAASLFENIDGFDRSALPPELHNNWAIPLLEYGYVLAYRKDLMSAAPVGWKDLWDTTKHSGKRGLRDFPIGNIEIALLGKGLQPEQVLYDPKLAPEQIDLRVGEAFAELDRLRPHVIWWKSGDQLQRGLCSGDTPMAAAWSGRVVSARRELASTPNTANATVELADASVLISTDWWIIPKGSPNKAAAIHLLNAMYHGGTAPTDAAAFAQRQGYSVPLVGATNVDDVTVRHLLDVGSSRNRQSGIHMSEKFWGLNYDRINARWLAWRAR